MTTYKVKRNFQKYTPLYHQSVLKVLLTIKWISCETIPEGPRVYNKRYGNYVVTIVKVKRFCSTTCNNPQKSVDNLRN